MKGYFVNRGTICTVSNDAIAAIRAHFQDANANPLPDDIQNPPSPMPATRDCTYVPTADERRTFLASPEIFACESQRHAETILAAIQDPDVRRRVRRESQNDARRVIKVVAQIRNELTSAQISNQLARISRHVKQGLDSISLMSWSRWRIAYDDLAFCLPATHALPRSYIAQDYRKAIIPLGSEFALLVATEIKIRQAENDDTGTAAAIHMVIEEQQIHAQRTQGRALQSTDRRDARAGAKQDPRKLPRRPGRGRQNFHASSGRGYKANTAPNNFAWNENRRLCTNHGKPGCNGRHLDKDCPLGSAGAGRALAAHEHRSMDFDTPCDTSN